MGDPICERLLTQKTSTYVPARKAYEVCPPFARQHPHVFLCSEIRNFAISFFFGSPSNQSNSPPSHCDTFVFTHPPLPGFGIHQNFGSLKTLQFLLQCLCVMHPKKREVFFSLIRFMAKTTFVFYF